MEIVWGNSYIRRRTAALEAIGKTRKRSRIPGLDYTYTRMASSQDSIFRKNSLKNGLQPHLQNPRISRRSNLPEATVRESIVGHAKVDVVKRVIKLGSELE